MKKTVLVTGANGHLGFNLTKELIARGYSVKAGIRNMKNKDFFKGLSCEVVHADLLDKPSLEAALEGVEILFQVAAVFKHWAKDPQKEIIDANNTITCNSLEAAKKAGVKRVVYVSSIAALDKKNPDSRGMVDNTTWNTQTYNNPYYISKRDSEKLAWELARDLSLDMVSVLPGAMVGGDINTNSYTLNLFKNIVAGKFPFDMNMELNVVDVLDVAKGMITAAEKGVPGKRYILANSKSLTLPEMVGIAKKYNPQIKPLKKVSKGFLLFVAGIFEFISKFTGKQPILPKANVHLYYGARERFDMTDSVKDLGYIMHPGDIVIDRTFASLC